MPLYEYSCRSCATQVEIRHGLEERPTARCPQCDGELERVFTVPRVNVSNYTSRAQARYGRMSESEMIAQQSAEHDAARRPDPPPEELPR